MSLRRSRRLALLLVAGGLVGCAALGSPFDPLSDLHPYLWLREARLTALTCRWPDGARLRVGLAPGAGPEARGLRSDALAALRSLELPLELVETRSGEPSEIELQLAPGPVARSGGRRGSGRSDAICAFDPASGRARLVSARVEVAGRTPPDLRGRSRGLEHSERLGILLHELGHALGFQGHPRRGDALLSAAPEVVRRTGARAARGETFASPGLAALYRAENGAVLWSVAVPAWRSAPVDTLAARASRCAWAGPWLRVGDAAARIGWQAPSGVEHAVVLPELARALGAPEEVRAVPVRAGSPW